MLLDQGKETQGTRFVEPPEARRYNDLRQLLADVPEQAFVLLGDPGSGKSSLLRRLQLDDARNRLSDGGDRLTFFLSLNQYRADDGKPREWLASRWKTDNPDLPPLDALLREGRMLLLLDALNEMPHGDRDDYRDRIERWQEFLQEALQHGSRAIFSCRSLDYSAPLSSDALPVRQVLVKSMSPEQMREFLGVYLPDRANALWRELENTPQFDLFRTPYFMRLLVEQVERGTGLPRGRAALFTGFVRRALAREIERRNRLFRPDGLLDEDDHDQVVQSAWATPYQLPEGGCLIPKLSELAYRMQANGLKNEGVQVRIAEKEARSILAHPQDREIVQAGVQLNLLDKDVGRRELLFFHQLLQEYHAARVLAAQPDPEKVRVEWHVDRVSPTLAETIETLSDSDPLPPPPSTGWEETTVMAAAMSDNADSFVRGLIDSNLLLAARCAASSDVRVSEGLKGELRQKLIARSQNWTHADLRARIAAGLALGELGDPRFERRKGLYGDYLLSPMATIPTGTYPIGDDRSPYDIEKPAHIVDLKEFQIGVFPVTNEEYLYFIQAEGYEDERWWQGEAAKAWRRGEGQSEKIKQERRDLWKSLQGWSDDNLQALLHQGFTLEQIESFSWLKRLNLSELETQLEEWYPGGKRYRQPELWDDPNYNSPSQPVVGVTWYEAQAYCTWLSATAFSRFPLNLGAAASPIAYKQSNIFRLPTEAEFEASARGVGGRKFPYGNSIDVRRLNTFESRIRKPTPIGVFDNMSPEGCFDLSGNVWSWTSTLYHQERFPYPYRLDDGRESVDVGQIANRRILRGGSWVNKAEIASATYRHDFNPNNRLDNIGFRMVCVSAIIS